MVATTAGRFAWDTAGRGAYWQHIIISWVALVRADLVRGATDEPMPVPVRDRVEELLVAAEDAARRPGPRLRLWLGGGPVDRAFVSLHAAQVLLARYEPAERLETRLRFAMTRLRAALPATAQRRIELEERCARAGAEDERRALLDKALEWSFNATDAQYARLRSFRNILSGVSVAVLALLTVMAGMVHLWPQALRLCFAGEDGQIKPGHARSDPGLRDRARRGPARGHQPGRPSRSGVARRHPGQTRPEPFHPRTCRLVTTSLTRARPSEAPACRRRTGTAARRCTGPRPKPGGRRCGHEGLEHRRGRPGRRGCRP